MGRAPCCEKTGLKRGPWSPEEDQILINYIQMNGHNNWRALPKKAGLLRCGKSCRLRWTNYLRPDIKRGDFSLEEEEIIIKLHELLGNKWSAIAAKLPGRTDNEIKNLWHTHLKKRLNQKQIKLKNKPTSSNHSSPIHQLQTMSEASESDPLSSLPTSIQISSVDDTISAELTFSETLFESLWQKIEDWERDCNLDTKLPPLNMESDAVDVMEFWSNVLMRDGEFPELQEII